MENDTKNYKRKTLWVNPEFQKQFILLTVGTSAVIVSLSLFCNWYVVWRFIEYGNAAGLPSGHEYFRFVYRQEAIMNLAFLIVSVLVLIGSAVYGLFMSNKIAGPVFRIQQDLEKLSSGSQMDKLRVREGDYFQELVTAINQVLFRAKSATENSNKNSKDAA